MPPESAAWLLVVSKVSYNLHYVAAATYTELNCIEESIQPQLMFLLLNPRHIIPLIDHLSPIKPGNCNYMVIDSKVIACPIRPAMGVYCNQFQAFWFFTITLSYEISLVSNKYISWYGCLLLKHVTHLHSQKKQYNSMWVFQWLLSISQAMPGVESTRSSVDVEFPSHYNNFMRVHVSYWRDVKNGKWRQCMNNL